MLEIRSCKYVSASELFFGCGAVWGQVFGDAPYQFGTNNLTLVSAYSLIGFVDSLAGSCPSNQIEIVTERLRSLKDDIYVDLES